MERMYFHNLAIIVRIKVYLKMIKVVDVKEWVFVILRSLKCAILTMFSKSNLPIESVDSWYIVYILKIE